MLETGGAQGSTPASQPTTQLQALLVKAGLTPAQVIVAATRNSADVLRLDDLGAVAAGKSVDFIVLDANPLDDIANTRKISKVYLRGAEVNRRSQARLCVQMPCDKWNAAFAPEGMFGGEHFLLDSDRLHRTRRRYRAPC